MRAFFTSSSASVKLRNERDTPSKRSLVTSKRVCSPNSFARIVVAAPLTHEWPDGYSGCAGVAKSGVQVASVVVAALPTSAVSRMAVIGRQKLNVYLASQHPMVSSWRTVDTRLLLPALWVTDRGRLESDATARAS